MNRMVLCKMNKLLLLSFLILMIGIPSAYAHPFLLDSEPGQAEKAPVGTTQIVTYYSEAIEIDFSELRVFDSDGNKIDNLDTAYYDGENSLVITTPPLEDGVYTVTSKVLSKIDGHLVQAAIIFGVGEAQVDLSLLEAQEESETTFLPEAAARFPGIVGQTIVLGSEISAIAIWGAQRRQLGKDDFNLVNRVYRLKFAKLTGISLVAVLASNFIMLAVQTFRLETSPLDVIETAFGATWLIRMIITIILLGIWFWMERNPRLSPKKHIPMLIASLILIFTTTMMGHGAATELTAPMILDYVHNLLASVWIGGVIFFGFVLLPTVSNLEGIYKVKLTLAMLPRYSGMITIALGILIITGPTLLWFLESDVDSLTNSTYGSLIIAKIILAIIMIGFGVFYQFKIQSQAERNLNSGKAFTFNRLSKPLKAEAMVGIVLLGVVALLVNSSLPAGEIQTVDAQSATLGFSSTLFSEQAKFDGTWQIEIEAQRTQTVNEGVIFDVLVKPKLSEIRTEITEYDFPDPEAAPLYPRFDGNNTIWISDAAKPRIWEFNMVDQKFRSHEFNGLTTIFLDIDQDGKIWFTDTPNSMIGNFDPKTEKFETIKIPLLNAISEQSIPIAVKTDFQNRIWVALVDKHMLLVYNQNIKEFEKFLQIETEEAGPSALLVDDSGNVWFAEALAGKIGVVDSKTFEITEFSPEPPLDEPFALLFDKSGSLWISEHIGPGIAKFDPILETFEHVKAPNPESLPFGMSIDKYDNIWFGQHITDELAVYDPYNDQLIEIPIPTPESFTQFTAADNDGNIWFVEQRGKKLGVVSISSVPSQAKAVIDSSDELQLNYAEIVSPLIAAGIIATSLFFVKSVHDKRRIDDLLRNGHDSV